MGVASSKHFVHRMLRNGFDDTNDDDADDDAQANASSVELACASFHQPTTEEA